MDGCAPTTPPLSVAITGASGLVGRALTARLLAGGSRVVPLVRREPRAATAEVRWDPQAGTLDAAALEGLDAVVNLAGAPVVGRWTEDRKRAILKSRVAGTDLLARTLAGLSQPPAVFVSASAIGYYGDGEERTLTEKSPSGTGFLAEVCREWEQATRPAVAADIPVVLPRIGMVLGREGGAFPPLSLLFRLGLGGRLGRGQQWMSWIHVEDLARALEYIIRTPELAGAVNAVAPEPVRNRDFTRILAARVHRLALLPAPAWALRLALGQMADEMLLTSQLVVPRRLEQAGFKFGYPKLDSALADLLDRTDR